MFETLFKSFEDASNIMATATSAANQQAVAAKELATTTLEQKQAITDSATRYNSAAQDTLAKFEDVQGKGTEAQRLAESNNIFDRVSLIGMQILDPRNGTADGRSRQVAEMSQNLAFRGQIHGIETNQAAAIIDEGVAKSTLQTTDSEASMNKLRAQVDAFNLSNQVIQQTETMRKNVLDKQDLPTLQKTLVGPVPATGKINIAGFEYSPVELREHAKALETREALSLLSPMATDPDFAQKMNIVHDQSLATYSVPKLQELKASGYVMPDGIAVPTELWDKHYARQNALELEATQRLIQGNSLELQIPQMMTSSMSMIQQLQKTTVPNTQLATELNRYRVTVGSLAKVADAPEARTPVGRMQIVNALGAAQKQLTDSIENEALRKANGDKTMASIYSSQLMGQPIQPSQIEDVVKERYVKGAGFGEIFASDTSIRIRKNADEVYAQMKQAEAVDAIGLDPKFTDKEKKEQAVSRAIEMERATSGIIGINMIQQSIGQRRDNPAIVAGMVPAQLTEIQHRATQVALKDVQQQNGLTEEQLAALQTTHPESSGLSTEKAAAAIQQINNGAIIAEYDLLEKHKPGLGYEMQQWYMNTLPEMAKNYTMSLDPIQQTMTGDSIVMEAQKLGARYTYADESVAERGKQAMTATQTRIKAPETMWPILLDLNQSLADSQKQAIYFDVVVPAIEKARSAGANDDVASGIVFDALTNYKSNDPTMMSAVKIMQRHLPDELDRVKKMSSVMLSGSSMTSRGRLGTISTPSQDSKYLEQTIPWIKRAQ